MVELAALAERITRAGARHAFGITGSGPTWSLITELEARGVAYHPCVHEASAALMAGAVARATGVVTPSISIKGPGLANALPGIVSNHYENAPALSVAEAYAHDAPAARRHKRLDQPAVLATVVKAHSFLDALDARFDDLVTTARAEAPGPVHIDLASGGGTPSAAMAAAGHLGGERGSPYAALVDRVAAADRPLVIVGNLASRREWRPILDELRVPVFTTVAAKGAVDERGPFAAGVFTGDGRTLAPEVQLVPRADLVVGIGLRNNEILSAKPFAVPLVMIDEIAGASQGWAPELECITTAPSAYRLLLDELRPKEWGADEVAAARRAMTAGLQADWLPSTCFDRLNGLDYGHALVLDTGSFCTVGEHVWQAGPDRRFMGSSNGRYMGTGLPTAIGLSFALQGTPVFCAVGDGGVRMYPAEIAMAVESGLPLCVILMADRRYASIAAAAPHGGRSRRAIEPQHTDWWRVAEAMGCDAAHVDQPTAFASVIEQWDRSGPLFIEAAFQPIPYMEMTRDLR